MAAPMIKQTSFMITGACIAFMGLIFWDHSFSPVGVSKWSDPSVSFTAHLHLVGLTINSLCYNEVRITSNIWICVAKPDEKQPISSMLISKSYCIVSVHSFWFVWISVKILKLSTSWIHYVSNRNVVVFLLSKWPVEISFCEYCKVNRLRWWV